MIILTLIIEYCTCDISTKLRHRLIYKTHLNNPSVKLKVAKVTKPLNSHHVSIFIKSIDIHVSNTVHLYFSIFKIVSVFHASFIRIISNARCYSLSQTPDVTFNIS